MKASADLENRYRSMCDDLTTRQEELVRTQSELLRWKTAMLREAGPNASADKEELDGRIEELQWQSTLSQVEHINTLSQNHSNTPSQPPL